MKSIITSISAIVLFGILSAGCQNNKPMDAADMTPLPRPQQLDRLSQFAGQWDGTMEMKDPSGKVTTAKGSNTISWEADKRILVEHFSGTMPDGSAISGINVWGYDPRGGHYTYNWWDSMGYTGHGTAEYNESTNTWQVEGESINPGTGQKGKDHGTTHFSDANTMHWNMTTTSGGKEVMQMSGTSKRR